MWVLLLLSIVPGDSSKEIAAQVVEMSKTKVIVAYATRDGRTIRAAFTVNDKTAIDKDSKAVDWREVRPGTIVRITIGPKRTLTRIKLPDTPKAAPARETDEEVLVDGVLLEVDNGKGELRIEKFNGTKLSLKLPQDAEIRLDGTKTERTSLKGGQKVRLGVLKKGRSVTRIFIYEVTDRPPR